MVRFAVIAYLSLATVLGPSLCCCNARLIFAIVGTSHCCNRPSTAPAAPAHHCHHEHCHGHKQVARHVEAPVEPSEQAPCNHDSENCPCGNRHAKLIAIVAGVGLNMQALELQAPSFSHSVIDLPVLPDFDVKESATTAHVRPADLFGTEMLRAYQTFRC